MHPVIRSILSIVWPVAGRLHPDTAAAIRAGVSHLKRGGSTMGAAGIARDPMARELFLRAIREAGL